MSDRFARDLPCGANLYGGRSRTLSALGAGAGDRERGCWRAGRRCRWQRSPDGWFEATAPCAAGARYRYRLADGTLVPDPACARAGR